MMYTYNNIHNFTTGYLTIYIYIHTCFPLFPPWQPPFLSARLRGWFPGETFSCTYKVGYQGSARYEKCRFNMIQYDNY